MGSTRINIAVTVLPNLFTLLFAPQPRIVGRLTRALGQQAGPIRAALTSAGPGQNRRSPGTLSKPPPRESGGPSNRRSWTRSPQAWLIRPFTGWSSLRLPRRPPVQQHAG